MSAERIATALGGRQVGTSWMAACPAHDDRHPSLSIQDAADGRVLVFCHSGCTQALVLAALQSLGIWQGRCPDLVAADQQSRRVGQREHDETARTEVALRIWAASKPASGTAVETYLRTRSLHLLEIEALRFHAGLHHPSGTTWPAMVALVTAGARNKPVAIHRTFLAPNGEGKAPVVPSKMMLGPCRGGAVRLAAPGKVLMVGEGIETCLAAMQATTYPAWAALSTSGLRALDLPMDVREVIVLADGDDAGKAAAREIAWRWKREGRRVRIAHPPQGMDFNDLLVDATSGVTKVSH